VTPFFFGTGRRRLFGISDSASWTGRASGRAIVLCNPWGPEYIHAHRSMRQLARRVSLVGFHALRFDYFGTGDSAGEMCDADLPGWEEDIETAIGELRDSTGVKRVALAGLRLGATLAASVAARRRMDVDTLVLWDPIIFGKTYVQELIHGTGQGASMVRPQEVGGGHEIRGFPLTARMAREFEALDLTNLLGALPTNTLIVLTERVTWNDTLKDTVAKMDNTSLEYLDDLPVWIERVENPGIVPVNALKHIVHWLEQ
jgi:pimeloyl-ACP methyl ester carboxylesterase